MLKPEEIRARIVLAKMTQVELAKKLGISRSQLSSVITNANKFAIEYAKRFGENPFQMSPAELKKYCKKSSSIVTSVNFLHKIK